jgi:hypothetical protein
MIIQKKITGTNRQYVEWPLDEESIKRHIGWANKNTQRFGIEIEEMASESGFPELITSVGSPDNTSLSGYGIPFHCRECNGVLVFKNGLRCLSCNREPDLSRSGLLLSYTGKIPHKIGTLDRQGRQVQGGPFLSSALERVRKLKGKRKEIFQNYFFTMPNGEVYFTPVINAFFTMNWPKSQPYIIVHKSYFDVLSIPVEHVYNPFKEWRRFCLSSSWREDSMKTVLKQRVIPRVYTDLMFADLVAIGKLGKFQSAIGLTLHDAYNLVGREGSEFFKEVYLSLIEERR